MATPESARKLFGPGSYPVINLLNHLHNDDDNLRKQAETLLNYTKKNYPNALVQKLFETVQRSTPLSKNPGIRCYDILSDTLPRLWTNLSPTTRNDLKIGLNYKIWLETDYEMLKACCSCVSSLACLLFKENEWDVLLYFMFRNLGSSSWNRKLGALLLWNDLIPKCPEVFVLYVDVLIEGFKTLMPTVSEDHRCGVAAARASVKLMLYFATPSSYSKFYGLLGHVIMTLFMALGEEVLVCSLLEDLIVLAGVETAFFKVQFDVVFESMVRVAENLDLVESLRESGCGMMQTVNQSKLLLVLIDMLVDIDDDPSWGNATSDDENEGEFSSCGYAMERLDRLAIALGENVIVPSCPSSLFNLLHNYWQIRHAAVTAFGLISEGCSKVIEICSKDMEQLVETIVKKLIHDGHPQVRWAIIRAIGHLSKYLSPHFQEHYHQQLLPALIEVLDDFDYPRLQTRATSTKLLFSHNCSADVLKPYLHKIVSKLVGFLQRGMTMMKEAAMETLASLAISSKEDSAYIYDSIMPYLKVILLTATKDTSPMLLAKSLECLTMITMAVGNLAILDYAEKVTTAPISLQETDMEVEDPMRCLLLQAWHRLCKCLGADFVPYLSVSMPIVIKSATLKNYLSVSIHFWKKKPWPELKEGMHLWVNEIVSALVPNITFKYSEEVRMAAIPAMPLLLNSAACAMEKELPVIGCGKSPVKKLSDTIITALLDALRKIPGSRLRKHQAEKFVDGISKVLSTCSYHKTEREKRVKEHNNLREQELLKEEAEQHLTICRNASFLPFFDKFLPSVSLMWSNDRMAEERRIVVHLFRDIAEQCREEVFRYYEEWIQLLPKVYYHKNPDVPQIVGTAIGFCAEFGGDFLKPHTIVIFNHLKTVMEHPNAKNPDNIMAYEAAVSTCGKLNQFVLEGIYTYEFWQYRNELSGVI
ncbi:uncharacterized protein LOC132060469 [Lycium ferocissimum]|uniref:uncharacterized protein LOC132060469 n=1 Tax=Lycium ferocissimum TaxID=112874 RepID=UPI0028156027|nr:uncharacterized protein LOC132060469 [Lycium ferocissimum]